MSDQQTPSPLSEKLSALLISLGSRQATQQTAIADFQEALGQNPFNAFEWSKTAMKAAAQIEVLATIRQAAEWVLEALVEVPPSDPPQGIEAADPVHPPRDPVRDTLAQLDRDARWKIEAGLNAESTSVQSNLMERYLGNAWFCLWHRDRQYYGTNLRREFLEAFTAELQSQAMAKAGLLDEDQMDADRAFDHLPGALPA